MQEKRAKYPALISTKVPAEAIPAIEAAAGREFISKGAWIRRTVMEALNGKAVMRVA